METKGTIKFKRFFFSGILIIGCMGLGYHIALDNIVESIILCLFVVPSAFLVDRYNNNLEYGRFVKHRKDATEGKE